METLPEIKRSTKIQGIKRNYLCLISKIAPRLANNPLFKKCLMEFKRSGRKYHKPWRLCIQMSMYEWRDLTPFIHHAADL